ncbi:Dynactin subunit 4 [Trichinella pseudospiralis]|uniref:Dynactin subunit 4 n=1 Tax=Trichinella pseudospiralis TaxID=6337 RepID=A0A0V1JY98_TRIPS|nr:Dynactin subunit 4 [Trichinella pseudospiralis]
MNQNQSSTVSVPIELAEVTVMQGLRAVRDLRQAMSRLFDTLKDVRETPVTDEKAEESDLWLNFKSTLQKIMDNFEILEKCAVSLSKQPVQFLHPNLNQQIRSYCTDETQIYPDIVYVYEWMKRIRESAQWLYNFVSQMSRRSQSRCLRKVFLPVFLQVNLTFLSHLFPMIQRQFPGMHIFSLPLGRSVSFNVQTSAVDALRGPCTIFKVAILLRGLQIEWANVKGPEELNQNCLEKADIYKPSQYIVFQKMTENVKCMIAQFNSSYSNLQLPQTLIRQFFNWLHYYRNIYSEPCIYCKKILKDNLPSCIREFRETKILAFFMRCCFADMFESRFYIRSVLKNFFPTAGMSTLYDIQRTLYFCSCQRWLPLCELYFCKHCICFRCYNCAKPEVDSIFCAQCMENRSIAEARAAKNRCEVCCECPVCGAKLEIRMKCENANSSGSEVEICGLICLNSKSNENESENNNKQFRLQCFTCMWSSLEAGIPDDKFIIEKCNQPEPPYAKESKCIMERFRQMARIEKLQIERKKFMPKRLSLFQFHPDKFPMHDYLTKQQMSTSLESFSPLYEPSEDVEPLDSSIFVDPLYISDGNLWLLTSMEQRLRHPLLQPRYVKDLLPVKKQLLVKQSLRCPQCDHNISKGEYVPESIKFKINCSAPLIIPELRLAEHVDFKLNEETKVVITITNGSLMDVVLFLLPDASENEHIKVSLPIGEISVPKFVYSTQFAEEGQELLKDETEGVVKRFGNKVFIEIMVTVQKNITPVTLSLILKHHHVGNVRLTEGEVEWLEHRVRMKLSDDVKLS